jgi:hypothetical protein
MKKVSQALVTVCSASIALVACASRGPEETSATDEQALTCLPSPAPQWWTGTDATVDTNAYWYAVDPTGATTTTTVANGATITWVPYAAVDASTRAVVAVDWVPEASVGCFSETHAVCVLGTKGDGNGASSNDKGGSPRNTWRSSNAAPTVCVPANFLTTISLEHNCRTPQALATAPACRDPGFAQPATIWNTAACPIGSVCKLGDVNHDGKADLIEFAHSTASAQVNVALSNGSSFGSRTTWSGFFCQWYETCDIADVDGNGMADIVATSANAAWVALSNGAGFGQPQPWGQQSGQLWPQGVCPAGAVCKLADMTRDGRSDLVIFTHDASPRVFVAPSTGRSFAPLTPSTQPWSSFFCQTNEDCAVGDVNQDGYADTIAFTHDTSDPNSNDAVWVGVNLGGSAIGLVQKANTGAFCASGDVCEVADVNEDGIADIVDFTHRPWPGPDQVTVGLGAWYKRGALVSFSPAALWDGFFCQSNETCLLGDVNGDGSADLVAATNQSSPGNVWVGLGPQVPTP